MFKKFAISFLFLLGTGVDSKPTKIMVLGSSLTDGSSDLPGYRYHLGKRLLQKGYSIDFVGTRWGVGKGEEEIYSRPTYIKHNLKDFLDWEHEERWGWNSKGILYGCDSKKIKGVICKDQPHLFGKLSDWLDQLESVGNTPDVVFLYLGTNDVIQDTLNDVEGTFSSIISTLRSYNSKIKIVWATIIPNKWDKYGENPELSQKVNQRVNEINQLITNMSLQMTSKVSPIFLVDLFTGFPWEIGMSPDFMHPNKKGLSWIGERFYQAVIDKGVLKRMDLENEFIITSQSPPPLKGRGFEGEDEEVIRQYRNAGMNLLMGFEPTTHNIHDFQGNLYALERCYQVGGINYMVKDELITNMNIVLNQGEIEKELEKYNSVSENLDSIFTGYTFDLNPPYKKSPQKYYEIKNKNGEYSKYNSKFITIFDKNYIRFNFKRKFYVVPSENIFNKNNNSLIISLFGSYPPIVHKPISLDPKKIFEAEGFAYNQYDNKVVALDDFKQYDDVIVERKSCEKFIEYPGDGDPYKSGEQVYSTNPWTRFHQLASVVKNKDPRKMFFVNLYPNIDSIFQNCSDSILNNSYSEYLSVWMESQSSDFGVYHQPLWKDVKEGYSKSGIKKWTIEDFGNNTFSFYKTMESWASESKNTGKPWWFTIPSTWDLKSKYILPTPSSLRFYTNSAIVYGAKGINWSGYYPVYKGVTNSQLAIVNSDKTASIVYPMVQAVNKNIKEVGSIITKLEWIKTIHGRSTCAVTEEDDLMIVDSETPLIKNIEGPGAKQSAVGIFYNPEDRLNYLMVFNKNVERTWDINIRFKEKPKSVWRMVDNSGGQWEKIRSADLIYLVIEPAELVFLRLGNNNEQPTVVSPAQPMEIGKNYFWHMTKEQNNKVKIEGNNSGLGSYGDGLLFLRDKDDTSFIREIMIHSIDDGVSMGPMIRNGYGKKASFAYLNVFRKEKYCFVRLESRNSPNGKVEQQIVSSPLRLPIKIRLEFKEKTVIGLVKQGNGRWIKVGYVDYKASQPSMGLAFIGKQDSAMVDFSPFDLLESGFNLPSVVYNNPDEAEQ